MTYNYNNTDEILVQVYTVPQTYRERVNEIKTFITPILNKYLAQRIIDTNQFSEINTRAVRKIIQLRLHDRVAIKSIVKEYIIRSLRTRIRDICDGLHRNRA